MNAVTENVVSGINIVSFGYCATEEQQETQSVPSYLLFQQVGQLSEVITLMIGSA